MRRIGKVDHSKFCLSRDMKGLISLEQLAQDLPKYVINVNDYEIGKKIGHGGFSEVYIGRQKSTGIYCAIKILNAKDLQGDSLIVYTREVSILAHGQNLFLLRLMGFTTTYPFAIITKYASKGNLYNALHPRIGTPQLSGTQKTIIALGIAYGMHRLHAIQVIHRDIKSLNILLDENGLPKICDFGLSRFVNNPDSFLTVDIGTPHWMAPELFTSHTYSNKVDIYSYGILLWELLTGTYPFQGLNSAQIAYFVCQEDRRPEIPEKVGQTQTPVELMKLIRQCWGKDPSLRPYFSNIYNQFAHHKVFYPDTDFSAISRVVEQIKADKGETLEQSNNLKQNSNCNLDRYSMTSGSSLDHQSTFDLSPIKDISSPLFISTLESAEKKLNQFQSEAFFSIIAPYFQQQLQQFEIMKKLLTTVGKLIKKGQAFLRCFIQYKLIHYLPFTNTNLIEPIYRILITVFEQIPSAIDQETVSKLYLLNQIDPLYTLHLINIYTLTQPSLPLFWKVADLLFTKDFVQNKSVLSYLKLLITLIRLYDAFVQHRAQYIVAACIKIIETFNGDACHTAYQILCLLLSRQDFQFKWNLEKSFFDTLVRHLNDPENINYVLNFLIRFPFLLKCVDLIPPLAFNATKSKVASALLVLYSDDEMMAVKLVETINVLQPLPTIEYTIRILLKILKYQSVIDKIPYLDLMNFLMTILSHDNVDTVNAAATMQTCLIVKSKNQVLPQFYESKFLQLFFNYVVDHENSTSWNLAINLINLLMKNRYDNKVLIIFAALEKAMEKSGLGKNYAITIVKMMIKNNEIKAYLSSSTKFPQCSQFTLS